jgi:hypothetical protein
MQVILAHQAQHTFVIDVETAPLQFSGDPSISVSRPLQRDLLHLAAHFHSHGCSQPWQAPG